MVYKLAYKKLIFMVAILQYQCSLDNLKIWNSLNIRMFWQIEILLRHHNSLFKEVLVDSYSIFLGNQHPKGNQQRTRYYYKSVVQLII